MTITRTHDKVGNIAPNIRNENLLLKHTATEITTNTSGTYGPLWNTKQCKNMRNFYTYYMFQWRSPLGTTAWTGLVTPSWMETCGLFGITSRTHDCQTVRSWNFAATGKRNVREQWTMPSGITLASDRLSKPAADPLWGFFWVSCRWCTMRSKCASDNWSEACRKISCCHDTCRMKWTSNSQKILSDSGCWLFTNQHLKCSAGSSHGRTWSKECTKLCRRGFWTT